MDIRTLRLSVPEGKPAQTDALLWRPEGAQALLTLGHGAGAGILHPNQEAIARALAAQQIATLRYQFPFMQRGGGRDKESVSLATVAAALHLAAEQAPDLPLLAGGHSFGGRMTSLAAAAGLLPQARGLVFFAFPLHAPGKPRTQRAAHLPDMPQPSLFLSGTRDKLAQAELLREVLAPLSPRAHLHWLDTADHGYQTLKRSRASEEDVFAEMARVCAEWVKQILR
ncbi:MAG: alpha/beta hydrolase [Bacteroidetes bacterium]|nr:MAG: alpha/beta hydrolase [Bacteroidota bacterium]